MASLYAWNRIGTTHCLKCGKKIRIGQIAKTVPGLGHEHHECPEDNPLADAQYVMACWSQHQPVPIRRLVEAAQTIINELGDKT